jgi:membrane-associated protease RseP (regulator of RpoE activity)
MLIDIFLYLFGTFWALRIARIKINKVRICYGKPIYIYWSKHLKYEFGYIPWGGDIFYDVEEFSKRGIITRFLLPISGYLLVLFSSILILSFIPSTKEFIYGFKQITVGSFSSISVGVKLIDNCVIILNSHNYMYGYALLSTKITAFNLFPIPPLPGGHVIVGFITKIKRKVAVTNIGFIILLIAMIRWLYIIIYRLSI